MDTWLVCYPSFSANYCYRHAPALSHIPFDLSRLPDYNRTLVGWICPQTIYLPCLFLSSPTKVVTYISLLFSIAMPLLCIILVPTSLYIVLFHSFNIPALQVLFPLLVTIVLLVISLATKCLSQFRPLILLLLPQVSYRCCLTLSKLDSDILRPSDIFRWLILIPYIF